jgi:hypothetical protein
MLIVWPITCKASTEKQIASGMEVATTSVLRHDPRNRRAIHLLNRQIIKRRNRVGAPIDQNVILAFADLCCARRQHNALLIDRVGDFLRRDVVSLQLVWVEVDRYGTGLSAIRQWNRCTLDSCQLRTNKVSGVVVEFLLAEFCPTQPAK